MSLCHAEQEGFTTLKRATVAALLVVSISACASAPRDAEPKDSQTVATRVQDPFEGLNRRIFTFNQKMDSWILKPVAQGYQTVTPHPVRIGVSNFFGNLLEITNTANDVLQWKWGQAGNDTGRFLINSTIGVAGVFDVAAKAGLHKSDGEDFGQTLAVWGVGSGPYLMVPFLGPATFRHGSGMFADYYTNPVRFIDPDSAEYGVHALDLVEQRAQLLRTESLITGDSYTLLRDFYLQRRNFLISDGDVEDDFGADDYGSDYYDDYD